MGLVIGVLSGLLGVGGGTLMVPVFRIGYALPAIACTATSLFAVLLTAASGVITHLRNRTCLPKVGLVMGVGGAVTSPLGVWLASVSPEWAILLAAAAIIVYSAVTMLTKAIKMGKKGEKDAAELAGGDAVPDLPVLRARDYVIAAAIGLVAGVASGYVGVGGGFLMVPMMMQLLRLPMKMTSGTSLIGVFVLAIPGVVMQAILGNIAWLPGISVAIGTIPGAVLGSRLIPRVPERTLRLLFAGMLFIAAIMLLADGA